MDVPGLPPGALAGAPVGIFGADASGALTYVNERWCRAAGIDAQRALGDGWLEAVHPADRARVQDRWRTAVTIGEPYESEFRFARDGKPDVWVQVTAEPVRDAGGAVIGLIGALTDITGRAHAEAERRMADQRSGLADRLAALSTLSAGIGHEINNPLAALFMSIDHASARVEALRADDRSPLAMGANLDELADVIREARLGAARIDKIVRGVSNLASPRDCESARECRVQDALDRVLAMTSHSLGSRIKIQRDYRPAPRVLADPIGLAQVFLNLIMNAIQSLQSATRAGVIRVATFMNAQGQVVVEVEDDGPGVPQPIARRIFEPFFTTKPPGFTGLGLAVSHEIVRNLGGTLELVPGRETGALFRMTLPAAELRDDHPSSGAERRLRVLILEEEYGLLIALKRSLGDGFLVATERDAQTALARLQRGERFDAVVVSLLLTEVTTPMFYEAVCALDQAQARRILFLTGLPVSEEADALVEKHIEQQVGLSARPDEFQRVVRAAARR